MSEDRLEGIERIINMRQYLTPVSRDNKDIQSVMDTETVEFQELWNALCDCFNNVYVKYMMPYGLSQWESIYKLHPHADETYADRRKRILAAFAGTRPYTLRKFRKMLDTIYGKGTLTPIVDGNKYLLNMQINWDFDSRLDNLHEFVEEIVPKNLLILYTYFFTPWDEVGDIDDDFTTSIDVSPPVADEYPWIGRYYNGVYSYGGSCQTFDGTWTYDGAHDYDGGTINETAAPHPLLYDGVSNYDGEYTYTPYSRASPPFIFYNSLEPDMLEAVAAVPELVEQYTACYQYNGGISYDGQTHYGYDKGPQESTDVEHILPQLADAEKESELQEADVTPNIIEMYPYGRTRYYNGAFTYDRMNTYDGSGWYGSEWKYDGAPMARPPEFAVARFDGATDYDGARTYEAPRMQGVRYDSYTADELHESIESVDVENIDLEEDASAINAFEAVETYASRVFDGSLTYDGASSYTTNYREENGTTQVDSTVKEQFTHGERFDAAHTYDGSTSYTGEADGPKDEINVLLYIGRQYNGLIRYDGGAAVHFDGTTSYQGDRTYAGFREISFVYDKSATYDGTRRYARPCETYDVYKVPA